MQASFIDDAIANDRQVKDLELLCRCEATITWFRIPNTVWSDDEARAQRDQASAWFRKYCIHLTFEEISFNMAVQRERRAKRDLDEAVGKYLQEVAAIPEAAAPPFEAMLDRTQRHLLEIDTAIRRKVGNRRLVVIFLQEWYVLVGETDMTTHWRQNRVSANDGQRLLR